MIPKPIEALLNNRFDYPNRTIIAQVATVYNRQPDLRSMGLFSIDTDGRLIFLTNTFSHKWDQLSSNPNIAIILLNLKQDAQIVIRGQAELLTINSHPEIVKPYWNHVPEGAKQTYIHKNPEGNYVFVDPTSTPKHPPENFGLIRVTVNVWEFLDMDIQNYPSSTRMKYEKTGSAWKETHLNAI